MGGRRITYKEQRIIEDLLRGRIVQIGEGLCKYKDKGSDDHVVAEARMKGIDGCTKAHVRHIRYEMFGDLKVPKAERALHPAGMAVPGVVLDQLNGIENNIAKMCERMDKMRDDLNLVMDYLTRTEGVNWTMEDFRFGLKEKKKEPA